MDVLVTPLLELPSLNLNHLKGGANKNNGLENNLFMESKQKRFLDQLALYRIKKTPNQFHGIDLSQLDLHNVDLSGVDLTGANLTNTNLNGAKLIGTNLTNAILMRTVLANANLADAILTNISTDRMTRLSLQQAVNQQWFETAQRTITDFDQKWEQLKNADGFNTFEAVLKRLNKWELKNSVTVTEIVEVIDSIIKSPDICRLVLIASHGANLDCHAHLLTIFNTAQSLTKFDKLLHANAGEQEILALAKGLIRQNLLGETTLPIMRRQWSEGRRACNGEGTGPNISDALKVQLALRHQLATQLRLPASIKNPAIATEAAKLSSADKEFAIDFINNYMSDQEQIVEALVCLPAWQLYLERVLDITYEPGQAANDAILREETEKLVYAEMA